MASNGTTVKAGIGPGFLLFCIFLVLKLTGVIGWSWWWVTAPLWIPFALVLVILGGILLVGIMAAVLSR